MDSEREATGILHERARDVAEALAAELARLGASAVILTGSFAAGRGTEHSDIDIVALGEGPEYELRRVEPFLVSLSFRTAEAVRSEFRTPPLLCTSVPGWRESFILVDLDGEAAKLQAEAQAWEWEQVREDMRRWVAEELTGLAEEVHKLVGQRHDPANESLALAGYLAVRLPRVMCVQHERLYGTDGRLWAHAEEAMGEEWSRNVGRVLGIEPVALAERCEAALRLYAAAAESAKGLFDDRQAAVVRHALSIIGTGRG